jgi:hypothetical protein
MASSGTAAQLGGTLAAATTSAAAAGLDARISSTQGGVRLLGPVLSGVAAIAIAAGLVLRRRRR